MEKKERKKEKSTNKERKEMNKIKISYFVFLNLINVSGTNRVDLALEQQRDVVSKLLHSSALFSWSCSYTLCTDGHFEPAPSLTKKYYLTLSYTVCICPVVYTPIVFTSYTKKYSRNGVS